VIIPLFRKLRSMKIGFAPKTTDRVAAVVWCSELAPMVEFLTATLGARVEQVFPADNPRSTTLSAAGTWIEVRMGTPPDRQVLVVNSAEGRGPDGSSIDGPDGLCVELRSEAPALAPIVGVPRLQVYRSAPAWGTGRAGMQYSDLVPDRVGGQLIASRIRIPGAGPVDDMVHHHHVTFQLIYVVHGAVRLVYEGQGEPFVMTAGDAVLQAPHIRHRVLESWDDLEVLEVSAPAEHITLIDHEMQLPTEWADAAHTFGGQQFVHHVAANATCEHDGSVVWRDLGIAGATGGAAAVRVGHAAEHSRGSLDTAGLRLVVVFDGSMTFDTEHGDRVDLAAGDVVVVPVGAATWQTDAADWIDIHLAPG
jgi:quercetin dioxygenase-like cupin family protein